MKTRIAIAATVIQALLFALHYAVYKSFVEFFGITSHGQVLATRIVFFVLSVSFLAVSLAEWKYHGKITRALYTAAAIWLGTFYCLLVASAVAWLAYAAALLASHNANPSPAGTTLFVAAIIVSAYGVWRSFHTKIHSVTIKLANLPAQWVGRRAVLIADTHFGNVWHVAAAERIVSKINALNSDVVFISGDFFDGTPMDYAAVTEPFKKLHPQFGVFFETGNHEEYGDKAAFEAALRSAGVCVLSDEIVNVDGVRVIGVGYGDSAKPEDQAKILQGLNLDPSNVNILLKHVPDNVAVAEQSGISLQLSGHTHVGQMWPLGYFAYRLFGKFYRGLNTLNTMQVFTTSGVGTWGPPQRIGTSSEIVVITFA